jgi:2-iminoacetate synthase ThiH
LNNYLPRRDPSGPMERPTAAADGPIDPDEARELLATSDVAALGRRADARRRRAHGDVVRYGPEPDGDRAATDGGHVELLARDRVVDPGDLEDDVDIVVAGRSWSVADHESLHDAGVTTDAAVVYGEDRGATAASLADLAALAERTGRLGSVTPVPSDERSTAYDDLRAIAVARLALPATVHVRVDRGAVGAKCAQTALAYGADDLGFAGTGEFDVELIAREVGDEPRLRGGGD